MNDDLDPLEEERRRSEGRDRLLFERAPLPMWVYDVQSLQFLAVNDAAVDLYGYSREAFLRMTLADIRPAEDVPALLENVASRGATEDESRWLHRLADGRLLTTRVWASPIEFDGRDARLVLAIDVTREVEAEKALRASEERFRLLSRATTDAIWDWDLVTDEVWWNEGFEELFGHRRDEVESTSESWTRYIHPDDHDAVVAEVERTIEGGDDQWTGEYPYRRADGTYAHVIDRGHVIRDEAGQAVRMIGGMTDLTERKELQAQLRQSQKMKSIGRLAGGIAHDFNNLLTVILGTLDLALPSLADDDPVRADLEEARGAAERASGLVDQLLAFSRRQVVQARVVDLATLLAEMLSMLERVIGEDVEVVFRPADGLWNVRADPAQIEQVLVNLVVNARDAMPDGGTLVIETANTLLDQGHDQRHPTVEPGPYVTLSVSDTGVGMDEETRLRCFEPFFTRKEPGRGTGLGLATVYGIVQQLGGTIRVHSEIGEGSVFEIYLPRADAAAEPAGRERTPEEVDGSETILVVEDEAALRRVARRMLEEVGYRVLEAGCGEEALGALARHAGNIDLVLTDVVMPNMSGPELSRRITERYPSARVIFTSGYSDDAVVRGGALDENVRFIQKPYTVSELRSRVRETLDGPRRVS